MGDSRARGANQVVLNVRKLDSLKPLPGAERTEYWDVGLHGFGVRVAASGRKTFTVRYSVKGTRRRKDLGVYKVTVSYLEARAEAERIISAARNGRDPDVSALMLTRAGVSDFSGLAAMFAAERIPELREATQKELRRVIEKELLPVWGRHDPNSLQPEEIDAWARKLAKRAPYVANRSFEYLRLIYNWAMKRRLLRYTPFLGLEKPHREEQRTRVFSDEELRRIFDALREEPKQMAAMWLLLFYTGNRLRETLKAEWTWLHDREQYLLIPKTVTKNGRDHLVPLVPEALDALRHLKELAAGSHHVFPGPKGTPINWAQKSAERVRQRSGTEDARLHDVRRTVASGLAKLGVFESIIDRTLNHTQPGQKLKQTYNTYQYIPEKRDALAKWVAQLTEILGYPPNEVLQSERRGYQGKGPARRLSRGAAESDRSGTAA